MNAALVKRVLRSALLGMLVFGGWAYAVNFAYPDHRLASALSQGMFSFFFSIVVMSITEAVYAMSIGRRFQVPLAIAVPVATSIGCAFLIHLAAHTPAILMTLLGPALIGTTYQTIYVLDLHRGQRSPRDGTPSAVDRSEPARLRARP